jgi:hypothetical protein
MWAYTCMYSIHNILNEVWSRFSNNGESNEQVEVLFAQQSLQTAPNDDDHVE